MQENIVVLGATSEIARALIKILASRGCGLILAGRNLAELKRCAGDLEIRYGIRAGIEQFDAADPDGRPSFWSRCLAQCPEGLHGVIACQGVLPDQAVAQQDRSILRESFEINLLSVVEILEAAAGYFESRRHGFIAAISSVAGDRGRQSNYLYGAAKAGLTAYLQGLRNRLHFAGVHVLTIKPGFVDTRMSSGKVNPKSPLLATPQRVASDIDRAIRRRKDVLYTKSIWRPIMIVIRAVPECLFKRMRL